MEGEFPLLREGVADEEDAVMLPDVGAFPFPCLHGIGVGLVDEGTKVRENFASPVVEEDDWPVDLTTFSDQVNVLFWQITGTYDEPSMRAIDSISLWHKYPSIVHMD
ncbi:MAG: hypothetical protein OXG37_14320 [Actinomycetia bacterium]|nr:hypothetical protein [Actinomycetes bacterium]